MRADWVDEPEWKRLLLGLPCYLLVRLIWLFAYPDPTKLPISILLPRAGDWVFRHERWEAKRLGLWGRP